MSTGDALGWVYFIALVAVALILALALAAPIRAKPKLAITADAALDPVSWSGSVHSYTDPRSGQRYLVFRAGASGLAVVKAEPDRLEAPK